VAETSVASGRRSERKKQGKIQFRAECTVPGCGWKGGPAPSQKRAAKPVAGHALDKHIEVRSVVVKRVVVTTVVEE
jgi:hypothetical protein